MDAFEAKGLGAAWLGIHPEEDRIKKTQELLVLPTDVVPLAIVAIGYPAEQKTPSNRFDARRVHRNSWK